MTQPVVPALHSPPAEWSPHAAIWTAWPADPDVWFGPFEGAQREVAGMIRALAAPGLDGRQGDHVKLLVNGPLALLSAEKAVGDVCEIIPAQYGDTWLRDTGPIFLARDRACTFGFNGWGSKFVYAHDDEVSGFIARLAGARTASFDRVMEGGALDWDGEGTVLTTRECLLNPNRNPWTEAQAEAFLKESLGLRRVIWIDRGLANDHTDGHVDNIARFVAPGVVVCQAPSGADDPNAEALDAIFAQLAAARDARGRMLQVIRIPSPGKVLSDEDEIVPASHMNFIIGNAAVIVPTYGAPCTNAALDAFKPLFPGRAVIGLPARHILSGGGAFHCITQQQPA
jgi:agmatine deiminase